jgi:hypothetical protein
LYSSIIPTNSKNKYGVTFAVRITARCGRGYLAQDGFGVNLHPTYTPFLPSEVSNHENEIEV